MSPCVPSRGDKTRTPRSQVENGSGWSVGTAGGRLRSFPLPGRRERLDVGRVGPRCQTRLEEGGDTHTLFLESLSGERRRWSHPGWQVPRWPGRARAQGNRPVRPGGTRSRSAPPQAGGDQCIGGGGLGTEGPAAGPGGAECGRRVAGDGVRASGCALAGRKRPVTRIRLFVPSSCWDGSWGRGQRWWQRSRGSPAGVSRAQDAPSHPPPVAAGAVPPGWPMLYTGAVVSASWRGRLYRPPVVVCLRPRVTRAEGEQRCGSRGQAGGTCL